MPVSFNSFPANWRLPLVWIEVDPSQAGLPIQREPALMVGQMLTAGTADPDIPIPVGSLQQAKSMFGQGSMLAAMFEKFFANSFAQEVWALPVEEPSSGNKASASLIVQTAPSDAGTLHLYIAGRHLPLRIAANDTTATIAEAIVDGITADPDMVVDAALASSGSSEVVLTSKWKGATGNDVTVYTNYYGSIGGEVMPAGLTFTYPANNRLAGGSGAPDFTAGIANLGENDYAYVALPFTDSTSLLDWEAEYGFGDTGRWGWMRQLYGTIYSAYRGTYGSLIAWGDTQNSGLISVLGVDAHSPSPIWEWSAAYASKAARALLNDPARPLQTLVLDGILSAPEHMRFNKGELNTLTLHGIATQTASFETGNPPMILRESTTYQLNKYGQSDDAYELITTMATLRRLFRDLRSSITSKFPRHKLADDGTRFGPGQAIVTPRIIKAEIVAQYRIEEFVGLVENAKAFKDNLIVERDPNDPNRVNVLYPPDLVNQLRVFAVLGQFRLQYNRGVDFAVGALA